MTKTEIEQKLLEKALVNSLRDIPTWTCMSCGCVNYKEKCSRCYGPKPKDRTK